MAIWGGLVAIISVKLKVLPKVKPVSSECVWGVNAEHGINYVRRSVSGCYTKTATRSTLNQLLFYVTWAAAKALEWLESTADQVCTKMCGIAAENEHSLSGARALHEEDQSPRWARFFVIVKKRVKSKTTCATFRWVSRVCALCPCYAPLPD